MIVVVMGVAGSGKTTVGHLLAEAIEARFVDADAFHSAASVEKMRRGVPLDDEDRRPWIEALAGAIDGWLREGATVVLACSALKASYRRALLRDPARLRLVHLRGDPALLRERLARREGHFATAELLDSQLAALEPSEDAIEVDIAAPPEALVEAIRAALRR